MYTYTNFKTKKQFKEAVAQGKQVRIYQPGGIFTPPDSASDYTGTATVEGPHYPEAHKWYATVELVNGIVVKVK